MNNIRNTRNRGVMPVVVLAVLAFAAARAQAQSDEVLTLDIPPQEAGSALVKLATSSGMQIMLAAESGGNVEVEGLKGEYQFEDALAALLKETGLEYQFASENLVVVQEVEQAVEPEESDEDTQDNEEEILELSEQRVTGSRMKGGDPTSRIISFSAEDLAVRGISSTEEIFRQMPWAFGSNTTQSNVDYRGPPDVDNAPTDLFGLGVSTVNLRAMGSANTLVLINSRRVGGLAGRDTSTVNLMNIPLSAIERVDIDLGGASAIYGADAVGGVVNFITKKRYAGLEATYREEFSATDADRRNMSLGGGYSWQSGSMTASVSREQSKPINNLKIWTSNDYRDQYGPEYDLRNYSSGQPGIACRAITFPGVASQLWRYRAPRCYRGTTVQLPAGHSGIGATGDDFTAEITPTDFVTPYNGADSTSLSFNLRVEQYLGSDLMIYAEALYSDHDAFREFPTRLINYIIPASNAYNPFGMDMRVNYIPLREVESGLFPPLSAETQNKQRMYNAGFLWTFGAGHELDLSMTRSHPKYEGLESNHQYWRVFEDPTATGFYEALQSSDPNAALNPFGDGSAQGSEFAQFLHPYERERGGTDLASVEAILRGNLFEIWGGPINYVVGGEHRERKIRAHRRLATLNGGAESDRWKGIFGLSEPKNSLLAGFMELGLPLVGERNARPGLRSLYLSLQARRDDYTFEGPAGGVTSEYKRQLEGSTFLTWVPGMGWAEGPIDGFIYTGAPMIIELEKTDTTPRVGLRYQPTDSLAIQTAWTQSFHPPSLGQQFSRWAPSEGLIYYRDPLHPSGESIQVDAGSRSRLFNTEVKSEYADKYSLSLDWTPEAVPGLRWTANWSRVQFTDKIESTNTLRRLYPLTYAMNPELVVRDADGYVLYIVHTLINLSEKVSELLETSVQYAFDTNFGSYTARLTYSRLLDEYYKLAGAAEPVDRVSTVHGSDKYKLIGQLTWQRRRFAADLFVYHRPGYTNDYMPGCPRVVGRCESLRDDLPPLEVGSLTTTDLTLTYQFDSGLRLRTGGRNLFKREAPTIYGGYGYDIIRWDARSRVLFLELHWAM